jgi:hypothetical protein
LTIGIVLWEPAALPPLARIPADAFLDAISWGPPAHQYAIDRQLWRRPSALHASRKAASVKVLKISSPDKYDRRRLGKSDDLDAQNAAVVALARI